MKNQNGDLTLAPAYESAGPFLKWAGGKGQLLAKLTDFFPKSFRHFYEPFLGSGAVFFHLRSLLGDFPSTLIDANADLINCFCVVKKHLDDLLPRLGQHQTRHNEEYYYMMRDLDPEHLSTVDRAARFIYLNKTCYNGLYRVNRRGKFNVPVGSYKKPRIFSRSNIEAVSKSLHTVRLMPGDFSLVLNHAAPGDFVYFDPPYYQPGRFTQYAVKDSLEPITKFASGEHRRLYNVALKLHRIGCHVIISNSNTKFIRSLYGKPPFRHEVVMARRYINCNGSGRGHVEELVITNR